MLGRKWSTISLLLLLALLVTGAGQQLANPRSAQAEPFANPAFNAVWNTTDSLVADGSVKRTWFWGPTPGFINRERYDQAPGRSRLVQYFEKGRMEINNPNADPNSPNYVTGGLLVLDMVSGNQQVGNDAYLPRRPSTEIVAGDRGDRLAPTYTSFRSVSSLNPQVNRLPNRIGQGISNTINLQGQVGNDPRLAADTGARVIAYSDIFGHNIPAAFWNFMNSRGPIRVGNQTIQNAPLINWILVLGYPISEPYWANVQIAGVRYNVMIQLFQRRTLVYAPQLPAGFRVQMGNVGTHYFNWLYFSGFPDPSGLQGLPPIQPPVAATPAPGPGTPVPPGPSVPPAVVGAIIPAPRNATISQSFGSAGTKFTVNARGFAANEPIFAWTTSPNGVVTPLAGYAQPGRPEDGTKSDGAGNLPNQVVDSSGFQNGLWAVTYRGAGSSVEAIAYFYIGTPPIPPTRAPAPTPAPTAVPVGILIAPPQGNAATTFVVTIGGYNPGEAVTVTANDPEGRTYLFANPGQFVSNNDRIIRFSFRPQDTFTFLPPGQWRINAAGTLTGRNISAVFTLQ